MAAAIVALFAIAAWIGVVAGEMLCVDRVALPGGPEPTRFERWHFVLASACIGVAVALRMPSFTQVALGSIAVLALAGCAASDFTCGMLPDILTLGPLVAVLGLAFASQNWLPFAGAAFVLLPFAAVAFFSRGRGMGWGDVKLATFGGALLGARDATLALSAAGLAAFFITRRWGLQDKPIAFGPYLAASIAATFALLGIH